MKEALKDKNLILTMLFTALIFIGMNFGHPVTPNFIKTIGIDERYFSVLFATMAFMTLIAAPYWGNKGDNYGRAKIIALGILGYGIGQIAFGLSTQLIYILIARAFSGFFAASIFSNLIATYSEISTNEQRPRYVSLYTSVTILAGSIGYLIGGSLGELFGSANTLILQGVFDFIVAISIFIFYPKTTVKAAKREPFRKNIRHLGKIDSKIIFILLATSFFVMGQNNNSKFLDLFLTDQLYTTARLGRYVFLTGIVSALTAIFIVPYVAKKYKDLKILRFCSLGIIFSLILSLTLGKLEIVLYGPYLLYMVFVTIYVAIDQTFLSRQVSSNYGAIMGVRESFRSLGLVIGPLLGGALFYSTGTTTIFKFNLSLFIISALLLLTFIRFWNRGQR